MPKRKPSDGMSPWSCRIGRTSIGPPFPSIVIGFPGRQPMLPQDRRILAAGRRPEAIAEPGMHGPRGRLIHVDIDRLAGFHEKRPQIVDAVGMVGMLMGEEDGVQFLDPGIQKLLPQVGRGIDQQAGCLAGGGRFFDQQRASPPAVLRIVRVAIAPAERDPGHAHRRAAAQDREAQAHARGTLENSRKKLSVVWPAISASLTPRVCASTLAVSVT